MNHAVIAPDFTAIKARQRNTWASGDYARIGTQLQWVGEQLAESLDLAPGSTVLDVAAGNGNMTLACARRGADVTSTDYVEELLRLASARATAEGLHVRFKTADAEALPFADGEFDAVVSTFGVMFAPDQERAAEESLRVCRSGGLIGLASWTPTSFIGQLYGVIGRFVPPPPGVRSPARWGDRGWLQETFAPMASSLELIERDYVFRFRSVDDFIRTIRTYYGPVHKAFAALDAAGQDELESELCALIARHGSQRSWLHLPSRYVEVVARKR